VNHLYQSLGFRKQATLLAACRQGIMFFPLIFNLRVCSPGRRSVRPAGGRLFDLPGLHPVPDLVFQKTAPGGRERLCPAS
jgi:hypothetical protein